MPSALQRPSHQEEERRHVGCQPPHPSIQDSTAPSGSWNLAQRWCAEAAPLRKTCKHPFQLKERKGKAYLLPGCPARLQHSLPAPAGLPKVPSTATSSAARKSQGKAVSHPHRIKPGLRSPASAKHHCLPAQGCRPCRPATLSPRSLPAFFLSSLGTSLWGNLSSSPWPPAGMPGRGDVFWCLCPPQ